MAEKAVRNFLVLEKNKAVIYHGLSGVNWWRRRQSHCLLNQWLKMRNADYAPTDTPKSIRLIKCLKSGRFYRFCGVSLAANRSSALVIRVSNATNTGVGEELLESFRSCQGFADCEQRPIWAMTDQAGHRGIRNDSTRKSMSSLTFGDTCLRVG